MKILLLSDTHGNLDKVSQIWEKLNGIDLIIHCGDYQIDAEMLEDFFGVRVVSVKGNCDAKNQVDHKIVETPHGKLLITHGHMETVGFDTSSVLYLAEENQCMGVCFGHTHVPMCEVVQDIYLINPGSLSQPRDGSNGSYVIIHSTEEEFYANIVYYEQVVCVEPEKKKSVRGGFLRKLLNNSDRF